MPPAIPGVDSTSQARFPLLQWQQQVQRYAEYWSWYTGEKLNESRGVSDSGETIYRFPLKMNEVRNFSHKHASVLLGEAPDGPAPMVKTTVIPKRPLDSANAEPNKQDKALALLAQNIINEVWLESRGRSIQIENAILQQFLGGCVFKVSWQPWRDDLRIPVVIEKVIPDFFMPVWNPKDYFDLLEVYEVYRIPAATAELQYGVKSSGTYSMYVEHWQKKATPFGTKTVYSIYIDDQPLTVRLTDGSTLTYRDVQTDWGFVPYVYIPTKREGSFYGHSIVEQIRGILLEYNARMADQGDAIRTTVHRRRYARNISQPVKERLIGKTTWVIDLGQEQFNAKHPPEVWAEDPPKMDSGTATFNKDLWAQLLREGELQNIAFGEDEGSQRSALTLAFRMWPTTARGRMTRSFWNDGMSLLCKMVLKIVSLNKVLLKYEIPMDFAKRLDFAADWAPMMPRDREQDVQENVALLQAHARGVETVVEKLGDVRDVAEEIARIHADKEFDANLQLKLQASLEDQKPEPEDDKAPESKAKPKTDTRSNTPT
jgi:hypothetical protein